VSGLKGGAFPSQGGCKSPWTTGIFDGSMQKTGCLQAKPGGRHLPESTKA
jgi:hypothetical protein